VDTPILRRSEAQPRRARRLPKAALVRFAAFVLLIALAFAAVRFTPLGGYLTKEYLRGALETLQFAWWAPLALVGLYLVLCPLGLPATPLMIAGAVVFGPWLGTLYGFIGLMLGAIASYLLAKRMGGELIQHYAGHRLRPIERALARHGFWYLVGARFFPLPFPWSTSPWRWRASASCPSWSRPPSAWCPRSPFGPTSTSRCSTPRPASAAS
jgi:uncharacterized membrane protein YdjX (TVP38/TMEM64 family)